MDLPSQDGRIVDLTGDWDLFFTEQGECPTSFSEGGIKCSVPGGIHTALVAEGILPNLSEDLGVVSAIAYEQKHKWLFKSFHWRESDGGWPVWIVFRGVDPGCDLIVNGKLVCSFRGMFGGPEAEITELLRDGTNDIMIHLFPEALDSELARKGLQTGLPYQGDETNGEAYLKPSQLMGGNGFPRLITAGIWQSVWIERRIPGEVRDLWVETLSINESGGALLSIHGTVHNQLENARVDLELSNPAGEVCWGSSTTSDDNGDFAVEVTVASPELWWPNGSGSQPLYELKAASYRGTEMLCKVGIRTIHWEKNTGTDSYLTIAVNGTAIFSRGANWPTLDKQLDFTGSRERYSWLLRLAVDASVNVIRFWGGYARELEEFYQECDRRGILILHDFPVANNVNAENVDRTIYERQVRSLIRQLRGHTCIAAWFGGNELRGCEIKGSAMESLTAQGGRIAREEDPLRRHFESSYLLDAGLTDEYEHYGRRREAIDTLADTLPSLPKYSVEFNSGSHSYFVASEGLASRLLPSTGFSWPPDPSVHLRKINTAPWAQQFFPGCLPARGAGLDASPYSSWEELEYYSDLFSGFSIRAQVGNWRSRLFHCSGSLVWCWHDQQPMFGFGAIDYFGSPKALYYFLKRAFAPICVNLRYLKPELDLRDRIRTAVTVINESGRTLRGYAVSVEVLDENLRTIMTIGPQGEDAITRNGLNLHICTSSSSVDSGSAFEVIDLNGIGYLFPLSEQCGLLSCDVDQLQPADRRFFSMVVTLFDKEERIISREFYPFNFPWFDRSDIRELPRTALDISETRLADGSVGYAVVNTSTIPSVWTRFTLCGVEPETYSFSDNWVTIMGGETLVLTIGYRSESMPISPRISWRSINGRSEQEPTRE